MMIKSKFKPWLLTDDSRPSLTGVYYDKAAHALRVTNGKAFAVLPVSDDDADESGLIPVEALKEGAKWGRKIGIYSLAVKEGRATLTDGRSWPLLPDGGRYPDFAGIISSCTRKHSIRLLIDPDLLDALAQASGMREKAGALLEFEIDAEGDALQKVIGVIIGGASVAGFMPMRLGGRAPNRIDDVEEAHLDALG